MEPSMKYILPTAIALAAATLVACERPASTSSTTVVQPTEVVKENETIVQAPAQPSTSPTIINPPAPAPSVSIEPSKPETTERSRTKTTETVDTPMGTATRETVETSK